MQVRVGLTTLDLAFRQLKYTPGATEWAYGSETVQYQQRFEALVSVDTDDRSQRCRDQISYRTTN